MSDKQQNKKKKKGKQSIKASKSKSLSPLPREIQDRLIAWSQLVRKEYGELRTVSVDGKLVRKRDRDVPYGWPDFMKGTENPVFRLKLQNTSITLTTATLYNTVYNLQASFLQNFNDLANMFDEYRFLRGAFIVIPTSAFLPIAAGDRVHGVYSGGACVDYGLSGALGSLDAGRSHDTWQNYNFVLVPGMGFKPGSSKKWPVHFEKLTDESWLPTTTSNTVVAYWKPYIPAAQIVFGTSIAFDIYGWFDIQVRGQAS